MAVEAGRKSLELEEWRDVVTEVIGARGLDPNATEDAEQCYTGLVILD